MNKITEKLNTIIALSAVVVLALIGSLAPLTIDTINAAPAAPADKPVNMRQGANDAQGDDHSSTLFGKSGIFTTITNVLLFLIGAISVIMLVYGGILYTTSGGNQEMVTKAKNTIMYAVVGIIVALLAFAVVNFVVDSFSAAPAPESE